MYRIVIVYKDQSAYLLKGEYASTEECSKRAAMEYDTPEGNQIARIYYPIEQAIED